MANYNVPMHDDAVYERYRNGIAVGLYCYMCGGDIDGIVTNKKRLCNDCRVDWRNKDGIPEDKVELQEDEEEGHSPSDSASS